MLSKRDIEKELGKGINIFPVIRDNFKENSINLTVSENAWTQSSATVYWYGGKSFGLEDAPVKKDTLSFHRGSKCEFCVRRKHGKADKYIILLPHTTLVVHFILRWGLSPRVSDISVPCLALDFVVTSSCHYTI